MKRDGKVAPTPKALTPFWKLISRKYLLIQLATATVIPLAGLVMAVAYSSITPSAGADAPSIGIQLLLILGPIAGVQFLQFAGIIEGPRANAHIQDHVLTNLVQARANIRYEALETSNCDTLTRLIKRSQPAFASTLMVPISALIHFGQVIYVAVLLANFHPVAPLALLGAAPAVALINRGKSTQLNGMRNAADSWVRAEDYVRRTADRSFQEEAEVHDLGEIIGSRYEVHARKAIAVEDRSTIRGTIETTTGWFLLVTLFISSAALVILNEGKDADTGSIVFLLFLTLSSIGAIASLSSSAGEYRRGRRVIRYLEELRRLAVLPAKPFGNGATALELVDVDYSYPDTATQALRDVNAYVERGSIVGIVGENGAGKSTLVELMAGLRDPTRGDLSACGLVAFQNQEPATFPVSLSENVVLGELDPPAIARLREVLRALPSDELRTQIEAELDFRRHAKSDRSLWEPSGGTRRLLGIARAISSGRAIVILDEPGRGLDWVAERRVMEIAANAAKQLALRGATVLIVTHRIPLLAIADEVLSVRDGHVSTREPENSITPESGSRQS